MNLELSRELVTCLAIAWGCFGAGVWILAIGRAHRDLIWLGKFLVALCPGLLSLFSAHSVTVCEQALALKKSEAVDDRIFLASITRADLGDGVEFLTEYYTDGSAVTRGQVPPGEGCTAWDFDGIETWRESHAGTPRRFTPLHDGARFDGHQSDRGRL